MEQVLAPRFEFTPNNTGPKEGFDYGPDGYTESGRNVGFNEKSGQFHFEIKGSCEPRKSEATRVCREDLNEVITAFVQDKSALERGLFDRENTNCGANRLKDRAGRICVSDAVCFITPPALHSRWRAHF